MEGDEKDQKGPELIDWKRVADDISNSEQSRLGKIQEFLSEIDGLAKSIEEDYRTGTFEYILKIERKGHEEGEHRNKNLGITFLFQELWFNALDASVEEVSEKKAIEEFASLIFRRDASTFTEADIQGIRKFCSEMKEKLPSPVMGLGTDFGQSPITTAGKKPLNPNKS